MFKSGLLIKYHYLIAVALLATMFILGLFAMAKDSAIVDEVAHIPAGYSYLKFGDYRLNPEHPPLIKDLAAFPLLFLHLKFPTDVAAWKSDANGQWEAGWHFIYHIGNNADQILFWSRLPILLLAVLFGLVLYLFCLRRFGAPIALLALFLFSLCPNIMAHSHFVTTDLGIAAFMFFAFYSFFNFLEKPSWKRLAVATVLFALAQLAKFSAILLYPYFGLLALIAVITWQTYGNWWGRAKIYLGGLAIIFIGSFLIVWAFYIPHTINMPKPVQDHLITASLQPGLPEHVGQFLMRYNHISIFKPLAHYLLGLTMVYTRVKGGNTTYFLGQVTNQSFVWYFPLTYVIKTPIPLLGLIVLTFVFALYHYLRRRPLHPLSKFTHYSRDHFVELSLLGFIVFYSYLSIKGNLNLGIRHLFPILPMIIILVAKKTGDIGLALRSAKVRWGYGVLVGSLLGWYAVSNLLAYPSYVAYFNELIGGPARADHYVTDSNIDWGQDLKRLRDYVYQHPEINKIAVDYFGGAEPHYYFCDRRFNPDGSVIDSSDGYDCSHSPYIERHAEDGPYTGQYIAISETYLLNDLYWSQLRHDPGYDYLRAQKPIAKIGYSIYIYKQY